MTMVLLESIGYCAHYSSQGDWAFDFALKQANHRGLQFNIFHFLSDPYDPDSATLPIPEAEKEEKLIKMEKELRFYYDDRLGSYIRAGFRVCEDNEWTELHHCLLKREFQLLVLPVPRKNVTFGGRPIEEFAQKFVCPVAMVGPDDPVTVILNQPARMILGQLELDGYHTLNLKEAASRIRV